MSRQRQRTRHPRRPAATFAATIAAALLLAACTGGPDQTTASDPAEETAIDGQAEQPDTDEGPAATADGVDEQVVGEGWQLVADLDTELLRCPPAELERTLVVTIDREALGGSDTLSVAAPHAQPSRLASSERTDTPTDTAFLRRHELLELRAEPDPVTQGDALDLDLVVAEEADSSADPEDHRPADVQVPAWDGVQWLERVRPDMEVVAATDMGEDPPADVRFEVDTSDLDPGHHVFSVVPAVPDPSDNEIEAAVVEVEVVAPEE